MSKMHLNHVAKFEICKFLQKEAAFFNKEQYIKSMKDLSQNQLAPFFEEERGFIDLLIKKDSVLPLELSKYTDGFPLINDPNFLVDIQQQLSRISLESRKQIPWIQDHLLTDLDPCVAQDFIFKKHFILHYYGIFILTTSAELPTESHSSHVKGVLPSWIFTSLYFSDVLDYKNSYYTMDESLWLDFKKTEIKNKILEIK